MSNAAILYQAKAYAAGDKQIAGIGVASEGFLKGFLQHGGNSDFLALVPQDSDREAFISLVREHKPDFSQITTSFYNDLSHVQTMGTLYRPGPSIGEHAWWRCRLGKAAFSICGVTHTTAHRSIQASIAGLMNAPAEEWDAVICTSRAVRSMVETILDAQAEYVEERFGARRLPRVQLPVIPLGIDGASFFPDDRRRENSQKIRDHIGAGPNDIVVLYVGRLSKREKLDPIHTYRAIKEALNHTDKTMHMVWFGWFGSQADREYFVKQAKAIVPEVPVHFLDGQNRSAREHIWHAADVFMGLVDNVQETYGLSPVEAMAAELPVIVSDWDGFRDTVRDGVDGYRVRTGFDAERTPNLGEEIARLYELNALSYPDYLQAIASKTEIDTEAAGRHLADLANDRDLRVTMGKSGRSLVAEELDWKRIIPRYQALWGELAERRAAYLGTSAPMAPPSALDPFTLFNAYPTSAALEHRLRQDIAS